MAAQHIQHPPLVHAPVVRGPPLGRVGGPAPGGGEGPSIGKIESPGGGLHCLSEVRNFILDVSKDVSWTPIRGGVESNVRARGRSRAARMGVNLVGHLELSEGGRPG